MNSISYIKNREEWIHGFTFYIPIRIRFSETDMFGHVNNISPFIYFEEARIEYLKELDLFEEPMEDKLVPVVADLQCDYLKQMYFGNDIKLYVKVNSIGHTSFDIHYMAKDQAGDICLTGRGRIVYIDREIGSPTALSQQMKDLLIENNIGLS